MITSKTITRWKWTPDLIEVFVNDMRRTHDTGVKVAEVWVPAVYYKALEQALRDRLTLVSYQYPEQMPAGSFKLHGVLVRREDG